jgi:FkbM family methyltransferase
MISYAQNFEDVMLHRVFRDRAGGFYVDVGAADPVNLNVTKWFYDRGWNGINIEPHPDLYGELVKARSRDTNLNCGAGARCSEALLFETSNKEWSSFDPNIRTLALERSERVNERTVPILTLDEILSRHGNGRQIDFLKIDVEGWERQVLEGLDLRRYRPTVILIEATEQDNSEPTQQLWEHLLLKADYVPVYFDGLNRFYLPQERLDLAQHFATPPNVFDKFVPAALAEANADRAERLKQIHALTNEHAVHLENFKKALAESEHDRARRLEQIHTLTNELADSEKERSMRLEQLQAMTRLIDELKEAHATELRLLAEQHQKAKGSAGLGLRGIFTGIWNKGGY